MSKLSRKLGAVPHIIYALYGDDITIWCPGGSEATVKQALDTTESFLADTGLALNPEKSELLLYRQAQRGARGLTPLNEVPISIYTGDGHDIPRVGH